MANEVALPRADGKGRRSFDIKIIVGGAIILLAVAYLVVAALPSGTAYYITVSELADMGERAQTPADPCLGERGARFDCAGGGNTGSALPS